MRKEDEKLRDYANADRDTVVNRRLDGFMLVKAEREKHKKLTDLEDAVRRLEARVEQLERASQVLPGPMIAEEKKVV